MRRTKERKSIRLRDEWQQDSKADSKQTVRERTSSLVARVSHSPSFNAAGPIHT